MEYLAEIFETLTESEKRVFTYIYRHQTEASRMNIQDVAGAASVSKTVVINTCQKLGFEGFGALKYYLRNQQTSPSEAQSPKLDLL